MKNQRLAFAPFVVFHFTQEDNVIASIKFSNAAANKVGGSAIE
jgi:hypothetical protein